MPTDNNNPRRLHTPPRRSRSRGGGGSKGDIERLRRTRSRGRSRNGSGPSSRSRSRLRSRGCSREQRYSRIREQEKELERERRRVRDLEEEVCRARRHLSVNRDSYSRHEISLSPSSGKRTRDQVTVKEFIKERPVAAAEPEFTREDVVNLLNSIKGLTSQPKTVASTFKPSEQNILPEFNPSLNNQRIDIWLNKVNECASVYGWDDKTIVHFAMQKLQGLAKSWYESLNTILYTWPQWQEKLLSAFPHGQNYGQSLEDMLRRKSRYNEPIEVYFYEKLGLLNQCDITGKRATECIIHGITDKTTKSSAIASRCEDSDQLLKFLMSQKESSFNAEQRSNSFRQRTTGVDINPSANIRSSNRQNHSNFFCFNCKGKGHTFSKCPQPIINCSKCKRVGHTTDKCLYSTELGNKPNVTVNKTMCISAAKPNSKFSKIATVNNLTVKAFVDFGSEVSLLKASLVQQLGVEHDNITSVLKGFGNKLVLSVGKVTVDLCVDDVYAKVTCCVVGDEFLEVPLLIGQSYTEQDHIVAYKSATELKFININNEIPFSREEGIGNFDRVMRVYITDRVKLSGTSSVRAIIEPAQDGYVLLEGGIVGKPHEQCVVIGGVYPAKHGIINVCMTPIFRSCVLLQGTTLARARLVKVVNAIVSSQSVEPKEVLNGVDVSQIHVGKSVNETDRNKLINILKNYEHCFASSLKDLGCTNVCEMSIEVNNKAPIVYRPYRLSHDERQKVRSMVDDMLEAGVIRESASEYASPVILVRKKDGNLRLCIDYRMLNSVTVKERYPMPIIEDEIARLAGQACFITLDLASGYYQVPISESSKPLTSFVTPDGQYEFNRMPFGLANAPAVFQRMMNKVLGSARFTKATAYIDDLLIYGQNVDDCLTKLEDILKLLEKANLTLNLAKCEFLKDKIDYLGYEISAYGVRPGNKKIQSVVDFPCPTSVHGVRQFLGLASYFRKFISGFAMIAHPLSRLLKKDVSWSWGSEQDEAFNILKRKLVQRPVLAIFNPSAETELHTDASKVGVGGILMQRSSSDEPFHPVAFYSRQTSPEEKNFHSYELETLAVICSLKKFRVFLLGQHFRIVSDCHALRTTFAKRDLIPRIARWWLLLQEFSCSVEYRPGVKMAHVDALSRNPVSKWEHSIDQYPMIMTITQDDWLHTLQLGDTELNRIRDILTSELDPEGLKYIKDNYIIKDNGLYKCVDGDKNNIRWAVPKGARWQICRLNHDEIGHLGAEKTLERIKKTYWFPRMAKFIRKYVSACIECAYSKKGNHNKEGFLNPIPKVEVPFHTLHIDHLGPFVRSKKGNSYILVVVDAFTKFIFIIPVRNTKTINAVSALEKVFDIFRSPDRIVSDRGTCFTSHSFKKFCSDKGIKHVLNAVASPQSNGQVERYNRTILDSLTAQNLNHNEREWDTKIGRIQWGLNNSLQKTTGRTPAEIMFGTQMASEIDPRLNEVRNATRELIQTNKIRDEVKDRIDEEQVKQKRYYDRSRHPATVYSEGDLVKITKTGFTNYGQSRKLLPSYIGPYRVVSVLSNDRYELAAIPGLSTTKNGRRTVVSACRMRPWVHVAALEVNDNNSDEDVSISDEIDEC